MCFDEGRLGAPMVNYQSPFLFLGQMVEQILLFSLFMWFMVFMFHNWYTSDQCT
jgi:hypothetical protein